MEDPVKRKVVKVSGYSVTRSKSPVRPPASRPASPTKAFGSSLSPPLIRPKAKLNSGTGRKVSSSIASGSRVNPSPTGSTPPSRAPSPFKNVSARINTGLPPTSAVKGRALLRRPTSASVPASPEAQQRANTAVPADAAFANHIRRRSGSISLHRTFSSSSLRAPGNVSPAPSSPSPPNHPPPTKSNFGPIKVKAKVSGLAKSSVVEPPASIAASPSLPFLPSARQARTRARAPSTSKSSVGVRQASPSPSAPVTPSLPFLPSARQAHTRARAPSISNSSLGVRRASPSPSASVKQQFYPITTAIPAANPHRFATTRLSPPPPQTRQTRPFLNADSFVNYNRPAVQAKVDPAAIPLPSQSPPTSTVSFSSRSSISHNTETSAEGPQSFATLGAHIFGHKRASGPWPLEKLANTPSLTVDIPLDKDGSEEDRTTDGVSEGPDHHEVKSEAKSHRKIADLEITNRSLLAINSSLETTKHKQAKEIRELKRKLRESRLILPPRTFQVVKGSLDRDDTASEDDGDEDEEVEEEVREGAHDETYKRVKVIIDDLIESGKRALETTSEDLEGKSGAKVLHAEEIRMWRDSSGGLHEVADTTLDMLGPDDSMTSSRAMSPFSVAMPDSDSEEKIEAMTSAILDLSLLGHHITPTPSF